MRDIEACCRFDRLALAIVGCGLIAACGCKSEQSLREKYRESVETTLKNIRAIDLDAAGDLDESPSPAKVRLDFDVNSPEANSVLLFRHEVEGVSDLLNGGKELVGYGGFHLPFEYFSSTASAVLGNPDEWHYIPSIEAFERNLGVISRLKYVAVITESESRSPRVAQIKELAETAIGAGFVSGTVQGRVDVFALDGGEWVGGFLFTATSSEDVTTRMKSDGTNDADQAIQEDFNRNAKEAIETAFGERFPGVKF